MLKYGVNLQKMLYFLSLLDSHIMNAHAREGYTSHLACLSLCVCHFSILEKAPFSGMKFTSVYTFKCFKCSTF